MVLCPEARRAVDEASGLPEVWEVPIADAREADRRAIASVPRDEVAEVLDLDAHGVPCRLYRPVRAAATNTLVVHLHGGGFVFGGIETQDPRSTRSRPHATTSTRCWTG